MDSSQHIDIVATQSTLLIDAIASSPDAALEHCGDWTNRALGAHIGLVWTAAATHVLAAVDEPTGLGDERNAPADPDELVPWLHERRTAMLDAFEQSDAAALAWTMAANDRTAGFWYRRMAHETTVHRVDAQLGSTGKPDSIDPVLASDGIDEYTAVGLQYSSRRPDRTYPANSLHLHCTDTEGEWMIVGDGGSNVTVTAEHAKGDAAVRGRAEDLLLWVWGRTVPGVEVLGDPEVANMWHSLAP